MRRFLLLLIVLVGCSDPPPNLPVPYVVEIIHAGKTVEIDVTAGSRSGAPWILCLDHEPCKICNISESVRVPAGAIVVIRQKEQPRAIAEKEPE